MQMLVLLLDITDPFTGCTANEQHFGCLVTICQAGRAVGKLVELGTPALPPQPSLPDHTRNAAQSLCIL